MSRKEDKRRLLANCSKSHPAPLSLETESCSLYLWDKAFRTEREQEDIWHLAKYHARVVDLKTCKNIWECCNLVRAHVTGIFD